MAEKKLIIYSYLNSDTWEYLTSAITRADGTLVPVIWSDYSRITLTVFEGTGAALAIGAMVSSVNSVDNPALFKAPVASQELRINTSKLPGILAFTPNPYELLLKVHDTDHPDGQVIADPKADNDKVTLYLKVFPGG